MNIQFIASLAIGCHDFACLNPLAALLTEEIDRTLFIIVLPGPYRDAVRVR